MNVLDSDLNRDEEDEEFESRLNQIKRELINQSNVITKAKTFCKVKVKIDTQINQLKQKLMEKVLTKDTGSSHLYFALDKILLLSKLIKKQAKK